MDSITEILNNFIENRLKKDKIYSAVGIVSSVDESAKTCNITLLTNEEIQDVRLETNLNIDANGNVVSSDITGFVVIPSVNSQVIATFLNPTDCYISKFSDIDSIYMKADSITFNSGDNGGLINIDSLTTKINSMISSINAELIKIQTGITAAGGTYTPTSLSSFEKGDYEDTTVIH